MSMPTFKFPSSIAMESSVVFARCAGEVLSNKGKELDYANANHVPWGSFASDSGVLCVCITLVDEERPDVPTVKTVMDNYPTAPLVYEQGAGRTGRSIDKIIVYGVNGTSITLTDPRDFRAWVNQILSTPIAELRVAFRHDVDCQIPINSTAIHRIESADVMNGIIKRVAAHSSMEQLHGLITCGLFDQALLLASLPMKMATKLDNVLKSGDYKDDISYYFPEEEFNNGADLQPAATRPGRDGDHEYDRMSDLCGTDYALDDAHETDFLGAIKKPSSADRIIDAIVKYVNGEHLYAYFHTIYGSQFVDIVAKFKNLDRTSAMMLIAKKALANKPDASPVLASIVGGQTGEFGPITSTCGIFKFADVHNYIVHGVNVVGERDPCIEKILPDLVKLLLGLEHTRKITPKYGVFVCGLDISVCQMPASYNSNSYKKMLVTDLANVDPVVFASFVIRVMVPAKEDTDYKRVYETLNDIVKQVHAA